MARRSPRVRPLRRCAFNIVLPVVRERVPEPLILPSLQPAYASAQDTDCFLVVARLGAEVGERAHGRLAESPARHVFAQVACSVAGGEGAHVVRHRAFEERDAEGDVAQLDDDELQFQDDAKVVREFVQDSEKRGLGL